MRLTQMTSPRTAEHHTYRIRSLGYCSDGRNRTGVAWRLDYFGYDIYPKICFATYMKKYAVIVAGGSGLRMGTIDTQTIPPHFRETGFVVYPKYFS